jgi:hypothetical protein
MVSTTGKPEGVTAMPQCARASPVAWEARYGFTCGDHELTLTAPSISAAQARAVREGEAQFALVVEEPVIFLCARFGEEVPWTSAEVCWHALPREARRLPPGAGVEGETRALLHVLLRQAPTGPYLAERNVTLWLDFTRALHEAIREQAQSPPDPRAYQRAAARLRLRGPSPESFIGLARARSLGSP